MIVDQFADLWGRYRGTVGQVMETLVDCYVISPIDLTFNQQEKSWNTMEWNWS